MDQDAMEKELNNSLSVKNTIHANNDNYNHNNNHNDNDNDDDGNNDNENDNENDMNYAKDMDQQQEEQEEEEEEEQDTIQELELDEEEDYEDEEEMFCRLPLHLCLEYLDLPSILSARISCRSLAEATDHMGPFYCLQKLQHACRAQNVLFVEETKYTKKLKKKEQEEGCHDDAYEEPLSQEEIIWKYIFQLEGDPSFPSATDASSSTTTNHTNSNTNINTIASTFDQMMKCFRILKYIPNEFIMRRSSMYGLYCQPIASHKQHNHDDDLNDDKTDIPYRRKSTMIQYPPCHRPYKKCIPCRYPTIPLHVLRNNHHENNPFQHQDKRIHMDTVYNACIPNIPPDVKCPSCQNSNRTLQLILEQYKSSSVYINSSTSTLLTYNPMDIDIGHLNDDDMDHDQTNEEDSSSLHVMKYAITMICTSCPSFKIVKPASPCSLGQCDIYDTPFLGLLPSKSMESESMASTSNTSAGPTPKSNCSSSITTTTSSIRQTFVTTQCIHTDCVHAVLCQSCTAQSISHPNNYNKHNSIFSKGLVLDHSLHCSKCQHRICTSCAERRSFQIDHEHYRIIRYCHDCESKQSLKKQQKLQRKLQRKLKSKQKRNKHDRHDRHHRRKDKKRRRECKSNQTKHIRSQTNERDSIPSRRDLDHESSDSEKETNDGILNHHQEQHEEEYHHHDYNIEEEDEEEQEYGDYGYGEEDEENKEWDYYD